MKKIYTIILVLAGLAGFVAFSILIGPNILSYLAQSNSDGIEDNLDKECERKDASISVINEQTNIRNTGSTALEDAEIIWTNTSGEYTESIKRLLPGSSQSISTPEIGESRIIIPGCEENLANYPETQS